MREIEENLKDHMYFVKNYSATDDFNHNDKPQCVLNSELRHYIYPFALCAPPPPEGFPADIEEIKKGSFAKTIPLCRYVHRLCTAVAAQRIKQAKFCLRANGTVTDSAEIFIGIVNNDVGDDHHNVDDGKRQSTYINIYDEQYEQFKNFTLNVRNLIIYTGAVPINCFPTSGNNEPNTVTLILQLSGALVQHMHYDFNWHDYVPHRSGNRDDIGKHLRFNGCAEFINFSFDVQTIDLPEHNYVANQNGKLENSAMSLMLMKGSQRHAGSPNPTEFCTAKFFQYIRKPLNGAADIYYVPPLDANAAVAALVAIENDVEAALGVIEDEGKFKDDEKDKVEADPLLFYNVYCRQWKHVNSFGLN